MSSSNNSHFSRGSFRKVYGPTRQPPQLHSFVEDGQLKTVDANKFHVNRELYLITDKLGIGASQLGEGAVYEEDTISFTNESFKNVEFLQAFTAAPIVVLTIDSGDDSNIMTHLTFVDIAEMGVGLSAPFTGVIRYRAIYSPSYPVFVINYPHAPSTVLKVNAGGIDVVNQSSFTTSFPAMSSLPASLYCTPVDVNNSGDVDVAVTDTSFTLTGIEGSLSSPITNRINFLEVV